MSYQSPYPRIFDTGRIVIPHATMTDIATVDCDVLGVEVTNTTAGSLTLTIQDKQGTSRKLVNAVSIDPGTPFILQFGREGRCSGGVSWQASATGLEGRMWGKRLTGWTETDAPRT